jgi:hypothetical protein
MTPRRFPPPWTIEEHDACFIVREKAGKGSAISISRTKPAGDRRRTC